MIRSGTKTVCAARLLALVLFSISISADEDRWWPTQHAPKTIVRVANNASEARAALEMMIQSAAGLAAKSVNEGRGDELVWVDTHNVDLDDWLRRWAASRPEVKVSESVKTWELIDRFVASGLIKGYILYRFDQSGGALNAYRPKMDCSVNVATSMAGLLDGIIVDERLEKEAQAHGLKRLLDVRDKSQEWCFRTYRDQFNRRMLCTQDPKKPHTRDFAIAQRAFTFYGPNEPLKSAMAWLEPLSPILGWNGGDEFDTTDQSSRYGHIQTATDWCMNLPVLMAGSEKAEIPKPKWLPSSIDWTDRRSAITFVQTDGDNVQWLQGNFFHANTDYWASPDRGKIPFGWSACLAHLAQLTPQAIDYAVESRSQNDFFLEWGGGYYYPDHFAADRQDRWDLLARHARRTWSLMQKTGAQIIGFNVQQHDSADAKKAYEVFAKEMDGILGILVFQYYPYEGGAGKVFWVKDRNGFDVPVVTARYAIWANTNERPCSGTPAKIAREIRQTVESNGPTPRYDWVISHAWSYFKKAPSVDEDAENLPQENAAAKGGARGYTPVTWCAERLPATIRVVSPEELLWRIRMQHNPSQTRQLLGKTAQ